MNRRTFNTRYVTVGDFGQLNTKTFFLTPAQIHSQQHIGPVLGFGTTRAGLNIDKRRVLILLTGKHPPEFKLG